MTALLIEDEPTAARRLRKLVNQLEPALTFVGELDSVAASVDYLRHHAAPDLIFLDIHLADGSSFNLFQLVDVRCPIIFTTAYDEYALQAFRVNALDYLLKPIRPDALDRALQKFRDRQPRQPHVDYAELTRHLLPATGTAKRFLIRKGTQLRVVEMKEVAYFNTEDKVTLLTTDQGHRYPIDYSLEQLEELVPPAEFFRINRQFIVRLSAIDEMHAFSKSRVKLVLRPPAKQETIVSTERSPHFKRWLTGE